MSSGGLASGERPRHFPLEALQPRGSPRAPHTSPRVSPSSPRRPRHHHRTPEHSAFGYESDDSSLSSNASGSNKSSDKVETQSRSSEHSSSGGSSGYQWGAGGHAAREWRNRRDPRQRRMAPIAPDRYLNSAYPFQVKYTPHELLNGSQWDGLSQDIWDKFMKSQQTEETFRKKMNLWRYLYVTIKTIFPRYGLYVVGSTMSGLGLDTSDMDLCLYVRPTEYTEPRSHALLHLSYLLHYIRSIDNRAELIHAKVPILKFRDARHQLQVDLNCNNVVGIRNTNLLTCYSQLDWRVRPLMAAAKLWARAHDINDARRRTLSSYSLTLMLIHFLQCGVSPGVVPCVSVSGGSWDGSVRAPPHPHYRSANTHTLGELFLRFLHYYAHFPYSRLAVSVRSGRAIPIAECRSARADKNDPHQWKLLCVEEPFDLTNTARCVYDPETFEKIVETFRDSYNRLSVGLRLSDAWPSDR